MDNNFCPGRDKMPEEIRKCRDHKQLDTLSLCNSCLFRVFEEIKIPGFASRSFEGRQGRMKL